MRMKKGLFITLIIVGTLIIGFTIFLTFMNAQMKKIPSMSAKDCLDYTLSGTDGAVITVGIIKDGKASWTVYGKDSEVLDPAKHVYEIGSLTKTITASMITKAALEGRLSLSDTIDMYLELKEGRAYPSLEELVTHTSGYKSEYLNSVMVKNFFKGRNAFYGVTDSMLLKKASQVKYTSEEHDWEYSNFGFALLGKVLESVYGKSYEELCNAFLSEYGMKNSYISDCTGDLENYWDWNKTDAYLSAGAVLSNIEDMLLYASLQLEENSIFKASHEKIKDVDAHTKQYDLMNIHIDSMATGWIIDEHNDLIWHNGGTGSYNSYLGFNPDTKTAVVVLSNLDGDYRIPATVIGIKLLEELQN